MAKIDIVKAKITYLQIMMVLLFGANISLISWLAQNLKSTLALMAVITIIILSISIIIITKMIFKKIETLGDYE